MCGFTVLIGPEAARLASAMPAVADALTHRGPDESLHQAGDWYVMGFQRLAIYGRPTLGDSVCGTKTPVTALFNGEIWNLRELVGLLGLPWDADEYDVIVGCYARWGVGFPRHLNGMYSIVVLDHAKRACLAFRDPLGIKPLFYGRAGRESYAVSSDIRGVAAFGQGCSVNTTYLADHRVCGFSSAGETLFAGISQLPPGGVMELRPGAPSVRRRTGRGETTVSMECVGRGANGRAEMIDEELAILTRAVTDCVTHVGQSRQVGLLLSGGLDSALLAFLIRDAGLSGLVTAFTIAGAPRGEVDSARTVAAETQIELVELTPDLGKFMGSLRAPAAHLNGFLGLGLYSTFEAIKASAPDMRVVLCGEGADELYGGYELHHYGLDWLNEKVRIASNERIETEMTDRLAALAVGRRGGLRDMIATHLREPLNDRHLIPFDMASMAHSIEVRVPYLHRDNVKFSAALPKDLLGTVDCRKRILRDCVMRIAGAIGSAVVSRPKMSLPQAMAGYQLREADLAPTAHTPDLDPEVIGVSLPTFRRMWFQETLDGVREMRRSVKNAVG